MDITTKPFGLNKKEYLKILRYNHLLSWKYLYAFMFLAIGIGVWKLLKYGRFDILLFVFILIPFFNLFSLARFVNHKENKNLFLKHTINFKNGEIQATFESGELSTLNFDKIVRIVRRKEYALLYFNKTNFVYLPKEAFYSDDDYYNVLDNLK